MKKIGAIALIALGITLWAIAAIRLVSVVIAAVSEPVTDYSIGFWLGTAFLVVLLVLIGKKAVDKGRAGLNFDQNHRMME